MISLEDFKKVELKIAEIESVAAHPNADRLYVLGIRIGEERKTIVAGVRNYYGEDELKGKKVVVVNNLEPAVIRGVESQGMLLAVSTDQTMSILVPERTVPDGLTVK